ncbi:APH(3') family aminoglycoside O-phosphotransferase [Paenibacillus arenilitoris]|uniref:Aminoglycoside 3'-phosphotransferase n=1 Tax=Paenibacillus arenilitoris TaxID=2772299 RepID=A0A927CKB9_9BACL|nr:APH(3') family aminoglycoside O-phosphotransferase [Paenibacillus arenilitoris]MBD2868163.1 aminoglycoside 3'-phosphotransferase [Paenibacillus arenilitoris]
MGERELTLPREIERLTAGCRRQRVTVGMSESRTYRLTGDAGRFFLKHHAADAVEKLRGEKERIEWLRGKLPVPEVVLFAEDETGEYLLLTEIAGLDASEKAHERSLPQLIRLLAEGLRMVHGVPIADCPFDRTLAVVLAEAGRRTGLGLVDEDDFDTVRQGRRAEDLYRELLAGKPASEDPVFTHGDYCLPNVVIREGRIGGFIDLGRAGIADRYQDLALAARSIGYNFGAEHVPAFLDAYGLGEPDQAKIGYYQLLDEFF